MAQIKTVIEVVLFEEPEEHIVRVTISRNGLEVGKACLPGGDYENAKAMAEGLRDYVQAGGDLRGMLPDGLEVSQ